MHLRKYRFALISLLGLAMGPLFVAASTAHADPQCPGSPGEEGANCVATTTNGSDCIGCVLYACDTCPEGSEKQQCIEEAGRACYSAYPILPPVED